MQVITTTNLLSKYNITQETAMSLLTKLSPNVDILPTSTFSLVKAHVDGINDDILLVGGHDVVPFGILQNPCSDPDSQVYSDAPYACTKDPLFYVPDKIVGRIPDEQINAKFDYLETVINLQAGHMQNNSPNVGWFNMVASVWKGISNFMNSTFNMNNQNVVPPVQFTNLPDAQILGKRYHYLNLHGAQGTPYYYGQGPQGYPIALAPKSGNFKDGIVVTEACYGGWLQNRDRNSSIPLMALLSGAVGVIASTAVAYGPPQPPADGADMLTYCFYQHLLKGETIGEAFLNAKKDFATNIIRRDGNLEPSNKKTLIEFNIYGSPSIKI